MMKATLLFLGLLLSVPASGRPATAQGQMAIPFDQPVIGLSVNGHPLRLKVDLGASSGVILNPRAAARAGLDGVGSTTMLVGPVKLRGHRTLALLERAGSRWPSRVRWFDRDYVNDADGVISPHDLPYARVVFHGEGPGLRAPFRLKGSYSDERGVHSPLRIAGKKVAVRFSMLRPVSVATGSAGALLAKQQGGRLEGEPIWQHIGWDISRPTRRLMLTKAWAVGGLTFQSLLVRLRDYRGKSSLPSLSAERQVGDIQVTGRGPKQDAENFLTIGLDHLRSCQSIEYSRVNSELLFRC